MFFVLSKLLVFIISPVVWLVALLLLALLARRPHWRQRWLWAAASVAVLGTNAALSGEAVRAWELPAVPLAQVAPHDAVVLLTGLTVPDRSPHDRVYLGMEADRFTNALWLYRAGKARRIIISGGSGSVRKVVQTEARDLATLLKLSGVPASAILLEERSRNTRENARYTQELLAQHPEIKSLILVTSAFHQRRALGCFRRVGLPVTPFPAGFHTVDRRLSPDYTIIPSAMALVEWGRLLHEISGYLTYKAAGYL